MPDLAGLLRAGECQEAVHLVLGDVDAFAVATPLLAPDGTLIAAISAAVEPAEADRLDDLGEELKKAVATLGLRYGLGPRRAG